MLSIFIIFIKFYKFSRIVKLKVLGYVIATSTLKLFLSLYLEMLQIFIYRIFIEFKKKLSSFICQYNFSKNWMNNAEFFQDCHEF